MNNNTLEFFVKMKDMMSGGLIKLAQNSQTTFTKITNNVKAATDSTKFLKYSIDELKSKLGEVNKIKFGTVLKSEFKDATAAAKRLETEISRLEGKGSRGAGGSGMRGLLRPVMAAVSLASVMSFGTSSVKAAMDFGAQKTSFGVLTGNRGTGNDLANNLRQLKQDTIMGPTVYKNAQTMLGFGITANKIIPDLKMLGDVSMGDADKLKRLTLAFSEVNAAGQLNGRRMLQFVNAGFNPLAEISRTTGKSMEELAKMMKKGEISAAMLENAFKTATSTGGRFNNMLNTMADTPLGHMKKLQGQYAAFKIDVGEALMPLASWFMEAGTGVLKFLNIHKSVPEILTGEKLEINSLIKSITNLNEGTEVRTRLMQTLKNKYPDIFSNLDIEKAKNIDILKTLNEINGAYNKKIALASQQVIADTADSDINDRINLAKNIQAHLDSVKDKPQSFMEKTFPKYLDFSSMWEITKMGLDYTNPDDLKRIVKEAQPEIDRLNNLRNNALANKFAMENSQLMAEISKGIGNKTLMSSKFSKRGQGAFLDTFNGVYEKYSAGKATGDDMNNLRKMWSGTVTAAGIKTGGVGEDSESGKAGKGSKESIAGGITGNGARVINVTIGKMVEKIEIHTNSIDGAMNDVEDKVAPLFLRILNSGAAVQ